MNRAAGPGLLLALLLAAPAATAGAEEPRVLRVGTSGDYAPFSRASPEAPDLYEGFDVALARRFAEARGYRLEWRSFRWPELLDDLAARRFEVAMSGVTVRPERSAAGRFSVPVARSGAVALVLEDSPARELEELRAPGLRIAVNAGGHLERVARTTLRPATIVAIPANDAVLTALLDQKVDAVVTDDLEAVHWRAAAPGLRALGPLSRDRKACLVAPDRRELARELDSWLLERERDGTLAELRTTYLGAEAAETTATPLEALLAAVDERLELMPLVAEAKRREGLPVRSPEREEAVIEAALGAARDAAGAAGVPPIPDRFVRALFEAQIEAAAAVQEEILEDPPAAEAPPDLESRLRPALLRIGEQEAWLLARLPGPLEPRQVEVQAALALDAPGLESRHVDAIAGAIAAISRYRK